METVSPEERMRLRRIKAEQAIQLAVQNKWYEALDANKEILAAIPDDVDAHNRSGKALMELGRYKEARAAYKSTLSRDPSNIIAKKNLSRMENLEDVPADGRQGGEKLDLNLFVEETGKTGFTTLIPTADGKRIAALTAGDRIDLAPAGGQLAAQGPDGGQVGMIDPKIGLRLASMMEKGNQYIAAVQSVSDGNVRIVIRETLQDPSQAGKLSFPAKAEEAFRAHTKESLLRWDSTDDEDADEDDDGTPEWDEVKPASGDDSDDGDDDDKDEKNDDD